MTPEERRERNRLASAACRARDREAANRQSREWYARNREAASADRTRRSRELQAGDPDRARAYSREWNASNPGKRAEQSRRRRATEQGRLEQFARQQLRRARAAGAKGKSPSLEYLGCDVAWFQSYLAGHPDWRAEGAQHLDHARPLASFDLTDEAQLRLACHWSNVRPLAPALNQAKGSCPPTAAELERHEAYVARKYRERRGEEQ